MAPIEFAYWVPNIKKGLVNTSVPQRTNNSLEYNVKLAQIAEEKGFTFALTQIRFMAAGDDSQYESVSFSQAILSKTERLNVIAAILPGPWHPALAAKIFGSIDHYVGGRLSINVVSGWWKDEQTRMGVEWPEHDKRYVRTKEFIRSIRGLWNENEFSLNGEFYNFDRYTMEPKPTFRVSPSSTSTNHGTLDSADAPTEGRRGPIIFMGGNSAAARRLGGTDTDWFFFNGNDDDHFARWIIEVRENARQAGRRIRVGINGFVIAKPTHTEAYVRLNEIVAGADEEKLKEFMKRFEEAGKSSPEGEGMWANASLKDIIQGNEGFRTGLIGSYDQVARRIIALKALGADLILTAFLHFQDEVAEFGDHVLPLVRQYEQEAIDSGEYEAWPTYENYPVDPEKAAKYKRVGDGNTTDHFALAEQIAAEVAAVNAAEKKRDRENSDANGHDAKRIKV
ncbi:hypothetical protein Q8F55_001000 [Vanrija albida]|uniref:Luciferase-like domain-containing protein n=1 Tax=Vanrija albida TaxID=181172 RepID=A0ABR3QEW1_9TREE